MVGGAVWDIQACEDLLRRLLACLPRWLRLRAKVVLAMPAVATGLERRALQQAVRAAGVRGPISFVEAPMAAAIGAGLRVEGASGKMIVDIGHGVTEAGITSLGSLVAVRSVRVGGAALTAALSRQLSEHRHSASREALWNLMGPFPATGRQTVNHRPAAMAEPLRVIVATIREALDLAPEGLAADVVDNGITLVGGGSLVTGVAEGIADATGLRVRVPALARLAVICGACACLENARLLFRSDVHRWGARR